MVMDFEYDGRRLSDFGYLMGSIDTSSGIQEVDIGCDITFATIKNNHSSIHSVTSSSYDSVFTTSFHIFKDTCLNSVDNMCMTPLDVREIMVWLNRRGYYKFKPFDNELNGLDIHYYGSFNSRVVTLNENIIGLYLTFKSNTPYAFGQLNEVQYITSENEENIYIYADSDEFGTIYPNIEIKCLSDCDLVITNQTSGNFLCINNCIKDETITIDGEHKIIISDNSNHNSTLPNDFNYCYFDIINDYGDNKNIYTISHPCELVVKYYPVKKIGVY